MNEQQNDGKDDPPSDGVSSPASTGGAGTFFEQHVDAYWLVQLLVRGIPPILNDCTVVEVCLQTEHLGWHTDDFLIVGQTGGGEKRKLAGQVKRKFTISATDEECEKAVVDFWKDFKNGNLFSPTVDRFVLVSQRGTNTLLEYFAGLLDCSRAARNAAEFEHWLSTKGFLNSKSVHFCDEIRTIIGKVEGKVVTAAEVWPFLKVLYVLSLDLHTATRQHETMIKSMLVHTSGEANAIGAAESTWNTLLVIVGDAMPKAQRFTREDLHEDLRNHHSALSGNDQRALRMLNEHSVVILNGIHSKIGKDLHLLRSGLVQQVIQEIESTQVILLSGPAGTGKSAVAKDAVAILSMDYFRFSFRAEEFAEPHFDATLQKGQIGLSAAALGAILAGQDRKVLLIESVERLLEKSTRDAFSDLLTLAASDKSWRIVLTCRDYSTDLVRDCFLQSVRVAHKVINVPELDDGELAEVETANPTLAGPLANPALRRILRNPYVIDKALQISWSAEKSLPQSEREFRLLFWQQIVRVDHRPSEGMPRWRERTFQEISLRRARALSMFISSNDLEPKVVADLRHDSLILASDQNAVLVAPAHDVLEDWAILQWIEEQYASLEGAFRGLSDAIGLHPAVRRAYRKWVAELVERDAVAADRLFEGAVVDVSVSAQFRDDTLVSLLRAPSSPDFLERHSSKLLEKNQALLRRVIHLLRVACVTTAEWLPPSSRHGSMFNVPDGQAWESVLRIVQSNLQQFSFHDCLLLLGLIEDWGKGVSVRSPYPAGAESVAKIAHWLLPLFGGYRSEDQRERTLKMIAKIPNAGKEQFASLLQRGREPGDRDRSADDLREILFTGMEGTPVARDLPDLVASVFTDYVLCKEEDIQSISHFGPSRSLEILFGVKEHLQFHYFPPSGIRSPILPFLRHHAKKGLDFLIKIFNRSVEWYAHPRIPRNIEPPSEIELKFGDGTTRKQWGNPRLWSWYRETSVGPYVLQTLLMALERWLFEVAEARPSKLDSILLYLLRRSDSAALSGVVASIATAYPHSSGEALLVLLRSPEFIWFDRGRMTGESSSPSRISGMMPEIHAENRIYNAERKESDALAHRSRDLETAIVNLQLGPLAAQVHKILDQHRAALPPLSKQSDDDRVWRLSLHRMDLREYTLKEEADAESKIDAKSGETSKRHLLLNLTEPEPDVKDLVDKHSRRAESINVRLGLLMWGESVFKRDENGVHHPSEWPQRLKEARKQQSAGVDDEALGLGQGGPGVVAAVCIRDHWQEMSDDDRDWCVARVCSEAKQSSNVWDHIARVQRFGLSADRPCAAVLALLLGKTLTKARRQLVQEAFVIALTHPTTEVRWYAAWGIGKDLWSIDRELALRCVNAIANEAMVLEDLNNAQNKVPYNKRKRIDVIGAEAAAVIRKGFWAKGGIIKDAYEMLDIDGWFGSEANGRILSILGKMPSDPTTISGFERTAKTMVSWWDADENENQSRDIKMRERNFEAGVAISELFENFIMHASAGTAKKVIQPILDAVDNHPKEVYLLVKGFVTIEDREPNTEHFWFIWKMFADRIRSSSWLAAVDDEYSIGRELISAIFLASGWKEEIRHWRSLEGYDHHLHTLFEELPASSTTLDDYVRFLYHIGEQSLPESFVRIAKVLQLQKPELLLKKSNTVFMLEVLLQRYVYGRPLELKREKVLRDAVLRLLDLLVENGSSAAFRMRDDFVTPVSDK